MFCAIEQWFSYMNLNNFFGKHNFKEVVPHSVSAIGDIFGEYQLEHLL